MPPFLALVAHPLRWDIVAHLAHSDLHVSELTDALGAPQSLVSYHLGRLKADGLVSSHRSSFDGRTAYYRLHLDRCQALLAQAGVALHPGLRAPVAPPTPEPLPATCSVLFACTGNGTRSQMAEALLRHATDGRVQVASAGSHPKPVHPNAVAVLAERGIDIADARSKSLDEFAGRRFDSVVTLCDRVREVCPPFADHERTVHWSIEDPSRLPGTNRATLPAFRAVADDLSTRIAYLLPVIRTISDRTNKEHPHG